MPHKKLMIPAVAVLVFSLFMQACSSAPYARGHGNFYGPVQEAMEVMRDRQDVKYRGRFAGPQEALEALNSELEKQDCFRVTSMLAQWGVLQPEAIFLGESVFNPGAKAYVFVPPLFDEREEFPSPKDAAGLTVYRIDQDAPHGNTLIRQLQQIVGQDQYCVRMVRMERPEDPDLHCMVVASSVGLVEKTAAPKKPEPPKIQEKPAPSPVPSEEPTVQPSPQPRSEPSPAPKPVG